MRAPLNAQGSKSWHGVPRPVSLTKQTHVHRLFSVGALVLWKQLHICISCRCSAGWVKHRAQISLQYSASVLSCLRTYPWFIFHLRSITEIVEEVVGWVREFKWRPMSHSEFAGFQRVWRRKKNRAPQTAAAVWLVQLDWETVDSCGNGELPLLLMMLVALVSIVEFRKLWTRSDLMSH